jgi:nicotinamide riboside transporter PnuC
MLELLSVAAGLFELMAVFLLARKQITGWPAGIIGNVLWITYALYKGVAYGLLLVCPVVFILNIYGWRRWANDSDG